LKFYSLGIGLFLMVYLTTQNYLQMHIWNRLCIKQKGPRIYSY